MALGGLVAIVAVVVVAVAFSAVHKVHEGHVAVYYRGGALLPVIEVGRAHRLRSGSSLWASMVPRMIRRPCFSGTGLPRPDALRLVRVLDPGRNKRCAAASLRPEHRKILGDDANGLG